MNQRTKKEEGFTLVELLVVIGIIAILTAISVPMFLSQRQKAHDASTRSDVKNLATNVETALISNSGAGGEDFALTGNGKGSTDVTLTVNGETFSGSKGEDTKMHIKSDAPGTFIIGGWNEKGKTYDSQESALIYDSAKGGIQQNTGNTGNEPGGSGGSENEAVENGGMVTTLAGSGSLGSADDQGAAASFNNPYGVAVDGSGNIYVADRNNHRIRKVTPGGAVTTLAGSEAYGNWDGQGAAAAFKHPQGVAVDGSGNVYVAEGYYNLIRKVTPGGLVTTLAGTGWGGSANGQGNAASFDSPYGIAVDGSGNVYVADSNNDLIRKVTPGGLVTTLAGSGSEGSADGQGTAASFSNPQGVAVDGSGNVYVADKNNSLIRKITPGGMVTTLAGSGDWGSADGQGAAASFDSPYGIAVDGSGNVYVADTMNDLIRKVTPGGLVTTLAGSGTYDFAEGQGNAASFWSPQGVAVDGSGNVYVADSGNNRIRKIE